MVNILLVRDYIRCTGDSPLQKLQNIKIVFHMNNGAIEQPKGKTQLSIACNGAVCLAHILIVAGSGVLLFSLVSCKKPNLLKIIDSHVHAMTQSTSEHYVL